MEPVGGIKPAAALRTMPPTTLVGSLDGVSPSRTADAGLIPKPAGGISTPAPAAASKTDASAPPPVRTLPGGLEAQTVDGMEMVANPANQMVRTTAPDGSTILLVPTYRTAVVNDGNVPRQQMTAVEIHSGKDGQPVGVDSVTQAPVPIQVDAATGRYTFSQFGQTFIATPDTLQLTLNGQPVQLAGTAQPDPAPAAPKAPPAAAPGPDPEHGVDTGVFSAFKPAPDAVVARRVLPDGNVQRDMADGSILTFNPELRILRQDTHDAKDVTILIPGVAMGQKDGGYLLHWAPEKGPSLIDTTTHKPVRVEERDDADVSFLFRGPDGRTFALSPYHLALHVVPAGPATPTAPMTQAAPSVPTHVVDANGVRRELMQAAPAWPATTTTVQATAPGVMDPSMTAFYPPPIRRGWA